MVWGKKAEEVRFRAGMCFNSKFWFVLLHHLRNKNTSRLDLYFAASALEKPVKPWTCRKSFNRICRRAKLTTKLIHSGSRRHKKKNRKSHWWLFLFSFYILDRFFVSSLQKLAKHKKKKKKHIQFKISRQLRGKCSVTVRATTCIRVRLEQQI